MLTQYEILITLLTYTAVRIVLPLASLFTLGWLYNRRFARR